MEAKSDDSAGSDSLDKSLQKICVADDMSQGECATAATTTTDPQDSCASEDGEGSGSEVVVAEPISQPSQQLQQDNSNEKQKTEDSARARGDFSPRATHTSDATDTKESTVSTTSHPTPSTTTSCDKSCGITSSSDGSSCSGGGGGGVSNSFETKVKQISQNLKATTLETDSTSSACCSASASNSSSLTSSLEHDQEAYPASTPPANTVPPTELDASALGGSDSVDDGSDHRSKKVRFHPDVKENDGGNRVIPKKKKKMKSSSSEESASVSSKHRSTGGAEMELDEDDYYEEEEEFDIEKIRAEAQNYLKLHPLSFAPTIRVTASTSAAAAAAAASPAAPLPSGLLTDEDVEQESESSEEEDLFALVSPENGVERILGKRMTCDKTTYLVQYVDKSEVLWETEEFVNANCPNLLNKYDETCGLRQDHLMRYVIKRQNMRQRYTDF